LIRNSSARTDTSVQQGLTPPIPDIQGFDRVVVARYVVWWWLAVKVVKVSSLPVKPNPHGVDAKLLFDGEKAQVVHITLKPGERLKRHVTPVDVLFYVVEGRGLIELGEERREVEADTLIESPAGIPHCWYNETSDTTLRILVIKTPRPTKPTKIL